MKFYQQSLNIKDLEGKKMKCKACGKELIGKEQLFCKSCWAKGTGKVKKGAIGVVGVASLMLLAKKGNLTEFFKGGSKDI